MSGTIDRIHNVISPGSYQKINGGGPEERAGPKAKGNIAKTSAKYIVENNKIVFERYDRYGKLISRVPWTTRSLRETA